MHYRNGNFHEYKLADALQEIDVPIPTKAHCRKFHGREVSDLVICGGGKRKGSMTICIGDSGSPLVCSDNPFTKPFVAGIAVGAAEFCRTGHYYNVHTEVAKYRRWIDNILTDEQA